MRHLNFHQFDNAKYRHHKNIGFDKISVEIKVAQFHISGNLGGAVIKSVEIKVAHYQIGGNLGGVEQ